MVAGVLSSDRKKRWRSEHPVQKLKTATNSQKMGKIKKPLRNSGNLAQELNSPLAIQEKKRFQKRRKVSPLWDHIYKKIKSEILKKVKGLQQHIQNPNKSWAGFFELLERKELKKKQGEWGKKTKKFDKERECNGTVYAKCKRHQETTSPPENISPLPFETWAV